MCDCIAKMDARLIEDHNTTITYTLFGKPQRVIIATSQVKTGRGQKKAVSLLASYCPFCGVKYEEEPK